MNEEEWRLSQKRNHENYLKKKQEKEVERLIERSSSLNIISFFKYYSKEKK
jgi:hypothetical protein